MPNYFEQQRKIDVLREAYGDPLVQLGDQLPTVVNAVMKYERIESKLLTIVEASLVSLNLADSAMLISLGNTELEEPMTSVMQIINGRCQRGPRRTSVDKIQANWIAYSIQGAVAEERRRQEISR